MLYIGNVFVKNGLINSNDNDSLKSQFLIDKKDLSDSNKNKDNNDKKKL